MAWGAGDLVRNYVCGLSTGRARRCAVKYANSAQRDNRFADTAAHSQAHGELYTDPDTNATACI
jgi:hypothetical protein